MATPNHAGYTESQERINMRWQKMKAQGYAAEVYGELTETEADALRQALELAALCDTDPFTDPQPETEAEQQAAEVKSYEFLRDEVYMQADYDDEWKDWQATRESDRPQ